MASADHFPAVEALRARLVSGSTIYRLFMSTAALTSVTRGSATLTMTLTADHLNSKNVLHGAVSATIVDFATGLAIAAWDGRQSTGASVDMNLSFIGTAKAGDEVLIVASVEKVGGSLAFVNVRVDHEGRVVTVARHTKFVKGTAPEVNAEG